MMYANNYLRCLCVVIMLIIAIGCSGGGASPVAPVESMDTTVVEREQNSDRMLWGIWELRFDPSEMEVLVTPVRNSEIHADVTSFLLPPNCDDCVAIAVNGFDPVTRILDADVTLRNPTPLNGYDVRGILFTNQYGHLLTNPDAWTELWDIPNGEQFNPFRAFAKDEDSRMFAGGAEHTENYLVYIPQPPQYWAIQFAVDASWPGNCKEPYAIEDFIQVGVLYDYADAAVELQIDARDWQNDLTEVIILASEITDEPATYFSHITGNTWGTTITNVTGLGAGEYEYELVATSLDTGDFLIYFPKITITETPTPTVTGIDPVEACAGETLTDVTISGTDFLDSPLLGVKLIQGGAPDIEGTNVAFVDVSTVTCDIDIPSLAPTGMYDVEVTNGGAYGVGVDLFEMHLPIPDPVDITPPWLNFSPYDVDVSGDYAYVCGYRNDFHIFDISDETHPVWVNKVEIDTGAMAVDVSGGYAYVGAWGGGLNIVDIDPPESAFVITTVPDDYIEKVCVVGEYAYVAGSNDGLRIFDIDPPEEASKIKTVTMIDYASGLAVQGDYAYLASGQSGLNIIDINPPLDASIVHNIAVTNNARSVDIDGSFAYLTDVTDGLHIVDITTPATASIVNTVATSASAWKVVASGGYAYVSAFKAPMEIIDVDPYESAAIVGSLNIPGLAGNMRFDHDYVIVADQVAGLLMINALVPASAYIEGVALTPGDALSCDAGDGYVYVANNIAGLHVVDFNAPGLAYDLNYYDDNDSASQSLAYSGGVAYVANPGVLTIVDVSYPEIISLIQTVATTSSSTNDVCVDHGYAYVAVGLDGLDIVDIDPPEEASLVKNVNFECGYDVVVGNGYAYVSAGSNGLKIVDVDPVGDASVINTVAMPSYLSDTAVLDGYAYCACGLDGLIIVDIDPPESAAIVNTVPVAEGASEISVTPGYAYIACWDDNKFKIIDIDPVDEASDLTEITVKQMGMGLGLSVVDNYAYISSGGLWIIQLW